MKTLTGDHLTLVLLDGHLFLQVRQGDEIIEQHYPSHFNITKANLCDGDWHKVVGKYQNYAIFFFK